MAQYHDLSDLKKLSRDLKAQAKAVEEAKKKALAESKKLNEAGDAFRAAMKELGVSPKDVTRGRVVKPVLKPQPVARQHEAEKQEVLEASLSDECDPVVFLESEDGLMFRRPDVPPEIPRRLSRTLCRRGARSGREVPPERADPRRPVPEDRPRQGLQLRGRPQRPEGNGPPLAQAAL